MNYTAKELCNEEYIVINIIIDHMSHVKIVSPDESYYTCNCCVYV